MIHPPKPDVTTEMLQIGDRVAYSNYNSSDLQLGTVIGFSPHMIRIRSNVMDWRHEFPEVTKYPRQVIRY